jgi:ribosome maturation factor RimP
VVEQSLTEAIEERIAGLGFELVELERAGSKARPVLRVRADRVDAAEGETITVDDCARISRHLEEYLDALPTLPATYVLEVSSPGVERPLVRPRDFDRFVGREVAIRGYAPLAGRGRRLEGELLGLAEGSGGAMVRLRLKDGEEIEVARDEIARAHLVFRWKD